MSVLIADNGPGITDYHAGLIIGHRAKQMKWNEMGVGSPFCQRLLDQLVPSGRVEDHEQEYRDCSTDRRRPNYDSVVVPTNNPDTSDAN